MATLGVQVELKRTLHDGNIYSHNKYKCSQIYNVKMDDVRYVLGCS